MDQRAVEVVEAFVNAGYPTDAAAVLLVELDGLPDGVEAGVETVRAVAEANGVRNVRVAQSEAERALLWKGRKNAFGAVARLQPDYYLHDTVVPRTKLTEVLDKVYEIAERHQLMVVNVFSCRRRQTFIRFWPMTRESREFSIECTPRVPRSFRHPLMRAEF